MIITIAGEHGSAGKQIGQLVAKKLNVPCYYKELVAIAAQGSGLAREFISGINSDENVAIRQIADAGPVLLLVVRRIICYGIIRM